MINFTMLKKTFVLGSIFLFLLVAPSCKKEEVIEDCKDCRTFIPGSSQRIGDAEKGKNYLSYGDFVDSGIPADLFNSTLGLFLGKDNSLQRTGINQDLNFAYTRFINKDGVDLIAPNCYQCHAGYVDGKFMIGLGNTFADFTGNQAAFAGVLDQAVAARYGQNSKEMTAYAPFSRAVKVLGDKLSTQTVGSNSADKLALVLAAHRKHDDLTWQETPSFTIPQSVYPVDVPAWWLLKKKNAMFHTAEGRGDFARLMMASSLLTLQDTVKARSVDQNFKDVLAYLLTLTPPKYSGTIDQTLASTGKTLFLKNCAKCHGENEGPNSYPNLLVAQKEVGTDPSVIEFYKNNQAFTTWYNGSWFSKNPFGANLTPGDGYVAPPLDGIWASAPYFHNGSVPTLTDVLDSKNRPVYWQKANNPNNYDHQKMGLKYEVTTSKTDTYTYDTSIKGYSNVGHTYGDILNSNEKLAVIEYLKTL